MFFRSHERRKSQTVQILYHGTSSDFNQLKPSPSQRKNGFIEWNGSAIFATPDYRIALNYTANKYDQALDVSSGVNLRQPQNADEPMMLVLFGGKSQEDALDKLYGKLEDPASCVGYIYHLDKSYFKTDVGLGVNERISLDSDCVLLRQKINRRELINHYVEQKQIILLWSSQDETLANNTPSM